MRLWTSPGIWLETGCTTLILLWLDCVAPVVQLTQVVLLLTTRGRIVAFLSICHFTDAVQRSKGEGRDRLTAFPYLFSLSSLQSSKEGDVFFFLKGSFEAVKRGEDGFPLFLSPSRSFCVSFIRLCLCVTCGEMVRKAVEDNSSILPLSLIMTSLLLPFLPLKAVATSPFVWRTVVT